MFGYVPQSLPALAQCSEPFVLVECLARFLLLSVCCRLIWQAVRYWTFHARERILDFASQRLTYRYPDFSSVSGKPMHFVAHDFAVSRLQAANVQCACALVVFISKLLRFKS